MEVCKLLGINRVSHSSKSEIRSYKFFKIKLTIHLCLSSCLSVVGIITYNAYNVNRFYHDFYFVHNTVFIKKDAVIVQEQSNMIFLLLTHSCLNARKLTELAA